MKNTDISKVKVGDLYVRRRVHKKLERGDRIVRSAAPALVVKVDGNFIDLYLPETTKKAERYTRGLKVLDGWRIRISFDLLEDEMRVNGFYFEDGNLRPI